VRVNHERGNVMLEKLKERRDLVLKIKAAMRVVGYDPTYWTRVVMYNECFKLVEDLNPSQLDVLEIGSGEHWRSRFPFKSYAPFDYPTYDICKDCLDRQFDLVICDNVFEHLRYPQRAADNVYKMLRPGGHFLNITPFLIRIHHVPIDCTRWTELGMSYFLQDHGFTIRATGSWGNKGVVRAALNRLAVRRGFFGSLRNEKDFPVAIWVMAERPHPPQ
jgi:SAM-dependent methyltransferase